MVVAIQEIVGDIFLDRQLINNCLFFEDLQLAFSSE